MGRGNLHTRFTIEDLIAEAQRELELRRQYYWKRIGPGRCAPTTPRSGSR